MKTAWQLLVVLAVLWLTSVTVGCAKPAVQPHLCDALDIDVGGACIPPPDITHPTRPR